jgi:non-lysosomal glucosylceramidase
MDRRRFIRDSVLGVATTSGGLLLGCKGAKATSQKEAPEAPRMYEKTGPTLFPLDVPSKQWAQFTAAGFSEPVCGLIYRKHDPVECGVPMGGIDTGCLDLDTDGTFGYCSIFSSFVPPRGKLKQPFLGITVDKKTWVLATRHTDEIEKVENASEIHYWGHYPVVDLEYETSAPVSVGLRAWTPFIPGDTPISNTPGAVFEVRLHNVTRSRHQGSLTFSFPGPTQEEAQVSPESPRQEVRYNWFEALEPIAHGAVPARRRPVHGELNGVTVTSDTGVGYTLAVLGDERLQMGTSLGSIGETWSFAANSGSGGRLPEPLENDFGTSLAVDFDLNPRETKTVRFVLAWYAPLWKSEGSHYFTHMYATRYPNSLAVAQLLARQHQSLLRRILNWQQAIYSHHQIPVWLRESLVNNLYLITEVGLWAVARPPIGKWCRQEDGLFAMSESPRECPQMECIPCSFYGNIPIVYFFPDLALSTLRGYKAYQFPDGAAPWIFGGCTGRPSTEGTEMAMPNRGYQTTTNGISYADMVDKYWLRSGEDEILKEFYPSVKNNMIYTMNLNTSSDGVISMPANNIDPATGGPATEWVEVEKWYGMTSHVGGLHLAQLRIVERMAERIGDKDFVEQCQRWFKEGSNSMETKMWAGDYYLAYSDPEIGKRSDRIFSCQLDGDWITRFHGLPAVFRADRAKAALATIRQKNARLSIHGTIFYCNPDGTPWEEAGYGPYTYFVSEQLMLAMTYIYSGEKTFGLEQARRCVANLMDKGYYWNQPCIVQAATGERISGYDYYQNMMLWSVPAAIEHTDLRGPCSKGGLVDLVIEAGRTA